MYEKSNVIYMATNSINGKVYIGYTSQKLKDRMRVHKKRSQINDESSKRNKFYNAIKKYGWDNFSWSIIEECLDQSELESREIYWINQYDSYNNGYNGTLGGDGSFGLHGEKCVNSKLKEHQVIDIKKLLVEGLPHSEIAGLLDVTIYSVSDIARERTWKSVKVDGWDEFLNGENKRHGNQKLNKDKVIKVKEMLIKHIPYNDIAETFGTSAHAIADIANGRTWNKVVVDGWEEFQNRNKSTGENHGMSKTNDSDVKRIKELLIAGSSRKEVAKKFNVSIPMITSIVSNRSWSHIEVDGWDEWRASNVRRPITPEVTMEIKKLLISGALQKDIANRLNVGLSTVGNIANNKKGADIIVDGWEDYINNKNRVS